MLQFQLQFLSTIRLMTQKKCKRKNWVQRLKSPRNVHAYLTKASENPKFEWIAIELAYLTNAFYSQIINSKRKQLLIEHTKHKWFSRWQFNYICIKCRNQQTKIFRRIVFSQCTQNKIYFEFNAYLWMKLMNCE